MSIYKWHKLFNKTGSICEAKDTRRPQVNEAQDDEVRAAFVHSSHKSTRHAAQQLNMPHTTVHKIQQKCSKCISTKFVTCNCPRQRSSLHRHTHLPDLSVLDFLFWQYNKDTVFMPPLVYHFARTCWEDNGCSVYSYPQCP
jgi:hypothetical protein